MARRCSVARLDSGWFFAYSAMSMAWAPSMLMTRACFTPAAAAVPKGSSRAAATAVTAARWWVFKNVSGSVVEQGLAVLHLPCAPRDVARVVELHLIAFEPHDQALESLLG